MHWTAEYHDGTQLPQYENNREHLFKEIDQDKLKTFKLTNKAREYRVDITPARKLIFFRRHFVKTDGTHDIHHFLGFQEKLYDHNITRLIEIQPNGNVILHDRK